TLVLVEIRYHCSWRGFLSSRLNLEESILFFFCFHNPFLWEFVGVGGPGPNEKITLAHLPWIYHCVRLLWADSGILG
ncbi:MAG TPA: hypothetical protein VGE97_10185, partial [Nitrososphaera sp.]